MATARTLRMAAMAAMAATMLAGAGFAAPPKGTRLPDPSDLPPSSFAPAADAGLAPLTTGGWGADGYRDGPVRPAATPPAPPPPPIHAAPPPRPAAPPVPPASIARPMAVAEPAATRPPPSMMRDLRHPPMRGGMAYRRPYRGWTVPRTFARPDYHVDFAGWGLPQPGLGRNWIRYYDDAVLIDGRGRIEDVRYDFDWRRGDGGGRRGYETAYDDGYEEGYHDAARAPRIQAGAVYRSGNVAVYQGAIPGPYAPGTTVVIQQPGTVTTTTVTEEVVTRGSARRWRRR